MPFDAIAGVWFDPDTGLPVDEWSENSLADRAHHDTEITAFRVLAASGRRAAGMGNELRSVYFGDSGVWCGFVLYRERGAPDFTRR